MPRDKIATNARIIRYLKEEFLEYGYDKASLNKVSAKVGITTAGLYKHFKSKEDMFFHLVKDTVEDFERLTSRADDQMDADVDYNPFGIDWMTVWTDFIYSHYDGVKLLICCSSGSGFESFEDDLIRMETEGNKRYAEVLRTYAFRRRIAVSGLETATRNQINRVKTEKTRSSEFFLV